MGACRGNVEHEFRRGGGRCKGCGVPGYEAGPLADAEDGGEDGEADGTWYPFAIFADIDPWEWAGRVDPAKKDPGG